MLLKEKDQELEIKIKDLEKEIEDLEEKAGKSTIKLGDKASEITDMTGYITNLLTEIKSLEEQVKQIPSAKEAEITSLQKQKISKFRKFISKIVYRWCYYLKNKQIAKKIKENEKVHAKVVKIQSTLNYQFRQEHVKRQNLIKKIEVLNKSLKEMQSKKNNLSNHNSKDALPSNLLPEEINASQCSNQATDTKNRQGDTNLVI